MGASILVHWPGATEEDEESHPGFFNDDHAWASWVADVIGDRAATRLLDQLGVAALISHTTDGMGSDEIRWTTPDELETAANRLRELVDQAAPEVLALIKLYETAAVGEEPPTVEFARDLGDVAQIAEYARDRGATQVTLGYYW